MTGPITIALALVGVLAGRLWSDIANAYKYAHGDTRAERQASAHGQVWDLIPKWLIAAIVTMGTVLIVIGGAQVWQAHQISCYNQNQQDRLDASVDLTRKRFDYDKTVADLLKPGNNDVDLAATQTALGKYITAAQAYFDAVDKSKEQSGSIWCGTPKG
jgi:hypothetical protein